ncbi:midnolin-B-like [Homarus americanus]|uniref:midnolin-B-like n=1 Tax=Homarus americanus TaxID=6706 RepID=UPI001C46A1D5|nr:midnolin-B-like [Homarus americanus]
MERGGGGSSSGGGSGLGEDNRCACGRTLQMVGVHVTPTTGGQFELRVAATDSIEFLRRLVSKRLRVPKERICLLYRDRHLREGTLEDNSIMDGARITLLPSVETGLLVSTVGDLCWRVLLVIGDLCCVGDLDSVTFLGDLDYDLLVALKW